MKTKKYSVSRDFEFAQREVDYLGIKKNHDKNTNLLLAKYANVGYYLVAPLLLGVFFGLGIDTYLDTKPLFTIICLTLGVVGVFYNLNKIIKDAH